MNEYILKNVSFYVAVYNDSFDMLKTAKKSDYTRFGKQCVKKVQELCINALRNNKQLNITLATFFI